MHFLKESVSVAGTAIVHTSQGDKVEVNVNELMGVLSKEVTMHSFQCFYNHYFSFEMKTLPCNAG